FVYDGKGRLRRRLEYTWSEEGSGSLTSLVSAVTYFGIVRSNFTGWVGFQFQVGANPLTVRELGRWVVAGNSGNHVVKLFYSDGTPIPNASVTVSTAGKQGGQFAYAALASPVTLVAGTTYAVMSQEVNAGDAWYDFYGTHITLSADANSAWAVWANPTTPPDYLAPARRAHW
ncbi:MAG: DUF4082 domain-containing protein, partial [Candidatus Omnitrophica bacterium]|nr:DUF4082 domain-containing protein [Candidatus Omnitrophota bacterium]